MKKMQLLARHRQFWYCDGMKAVRFHVHGHLIEANGRFGLLLLDAEPAEKTADSLYLRFAFTRQGTEHHLFPGFLLDDWGKEVRGRALYEWVADYGDQFPRAEIFGFTPGGAETQLFLRELELYARLACYAYPEPETAVMDGHLVEAVLLPEVATVEPVKIKRPAAIKRPLALARLRWWQVPITLGRVELAQNGRLTPLLPSRKVDITN